MLRTTKFLASVAIASVLFLLPAGPVAAQLEAGVLFGTITDESGEPLAQVKVTLTSQGSSFVRITDKEGQVRFGSLAPGNYEMKAEHASFEPVFYDSVEILVGRPTSMHLRMAQDAGEARVVTS